MSMPLSFAKSHNGRPGRTNVSAGGILTAVNIPLVIVLIVMLAVGLSTVYAATQQTTDYSFSRQVLGVGMGVVIMVLFWIFDYRRFSNWVIPLLVLDIFLILLPYTPLGFESNGARSWIAIGSFSFQPSEIAKPVSIVMLASYASRFDGDISAGKDYLRCLGLLIVPFVLLAKEDLGSALVIFIIGMVIFFVGGLSRKWVLTTIMVCMVGVAGLFALNAGLSTVTNGDVKLIKDYQMSRLLVFIDQNNEDYADDAYNLNQAEIAVGSGEVTGKGYGNASQSAGGFLPEFATDFIFCVFAEMYGFVGCAGLLLIYLALLAVALSIGLRSGDLAGSLITAGVMGMWLFQIIENIGMDIGLMPITGIPLPFMSYGSSFMLANFICVGLLMSVWARRNAGAVNKGKAGRLDG